MNTSTFLCILLSNILISILGILLKEVQLKYKTARKIQILLTAIFLVNAVYFLSITNTFYKYL